MHFKKCLFKCCPKFFFQQYNVLKEIFPGAQLKIQSVGLSNENKNAESQLGKWLKWFFELHFVDAVKVEDIFVDLMSVVPDDEKCIKFADYLVENYVSNVSTTTKMSKIFC